LIALVAGVLGARLSHVLENLPQYTNPARSALDNFLDAINIRGGGLTYYGGFLLAFPLLVIYAIKKKVPIRLGMDIVAPCLMIGLGFGRIGCFLNGCCYGAECQLPWAVTYPYHSIAYQDEFSTGKLTPPDELLVPLKDGRVRLVREDELKRGSAVQEDSPLKQRLPLDARAAQLARAQRSNPVHPAQLYSVLTAFLIAGICVSYFTLPHAVGRVFALMLVLEGITRYVLELLRVEPSVWGTRLSLSMWLGLGMVLLGAVLWVAFGKAGETRAQPVLRA
jgi:phosphatidylglycerol:prolipoprotein diacylglycerol transferase